MKYSNYSAVIIGSGIAGLYLAYKLSLNNKFKDGILLVSKKEIGVSNSKYAQGGIVAVLGQNASDSTALHVKDTLAAGAGLNDFHVVSYISEASEEVIKDLIKIGVQFDKDEKGKLKFTLEGAHSTPRILHAGGDATGRVIAEKLIEVVQAQKNITIYENALAVELLCDMEKNCKGVIVYREETDDYEAIYSGATVLATGGCGQVYKYTTNPKTAIGGGIVLAKEVGANIQDMEFVQFHPTALNIKSGNKMPLISESVRGEGAILVDDLGNDFMPKYDPRASLAPRDVVTRAIIEYLKENPEREIFLDISNIELSQFKSRFPTITKICEENGIDLKKNLIPVAPSAHYLMGGIKATVQGETNINNLYAIGECSRTGLHGANRLASNSLLECVVTAYELSMLLDEKPQTTVKKLDESIKNTLNIYDEHIELEEFDCQSIQENIKEIMWKNVGIERCEKDMLEALYELNNIKKMFSSKKYINFEHYETKTMLECAIIITESALKRKESIGSHFRIDEIRGNREDKREIRENEISIKWFYFRRTC